MILAGIDVGGTFTDLIVFDTTSGKSAAVKVPSDRAAPDRAVLAALAKAGLALPGIDLIVHGTTVATNALLERRGARTAFITTRGFRDVLELGRTTRLTPGSLYDPYFRKWPPLALRRDRHVLDERVAPDGAVATAPAPGDVDTLAARLREAGIEAVAVGFLNAYANDANEAAVAARLRASFEHVCTSTEVINEAREYERFSTCAANAYVMPAMARYVGRLVSGLREGGYRRPFYTMASHGGLLSDQSVARGPVRTMLSGPAGGLTAARHLMQSLGVPDYITYDMGGTSTDVALIAADGWPLKRETVLQGMIVRTPQLDIHTIGAGGGSIARFDPGGSLLVGPESAGAVPGPACYGRGGTQATVTDADVALGRLGASQRLGDSLDIDAGRARDVIAPLASAKRIDVAAMAEGIAALANAKMAAAIYEVSVARGHDPRDFVLLPYGGAGPLHACDIAAEIGIPRVIVPPVPGAFSAFGTLCSGLVKDRAATVLLPLDPASARHIRARFTVLADALRLEFEEEAVDTTGLAVECQIDARYAGQAHELIVGVAADADATDMRRRFEDAFEREYGRLDRDKAIEVVNVRVLVRVPTPAPAHVVLPGDAAGAAACTTRRVRTAGLDVDAPVFARASLARGQRIAGPAIVEEMSATTWVPPGWSGHVGRLGELDLSNIPAGAGTVVP
jgi:N-methylhydantoinase A